jgi:hypothetical protein
VTGPIVYRSRDPQVIGTWQEMTWAIADYVAAVGKILAAAGADGYPAVYDTKDRYHGRFTGLAVPPDKQLPPGWRMNGDCAVPDTCRAAGRWVAAALAEVKHPGDPRQALIGMPGDVLTPDGLTGCGVQLLEDGAALYVTWRGSALTSGAVTGTATAVDLRLWERADPGEYHAAATGAHSATAAGGGAAA